MPDDPLMIAVAPVSTDTLRTASIPVDKVTTTWRTLLTVVVPAAAGDFLDVSAWARVTNDVGRDRGDAGYTVGVGWHLWVYDADLPEPVAARPWWRLGPSCGDNVTRVRHHMPMPITAPRYTVPEDWPQGHRMVVVLRADAHSTAAVSGDLLTVDPLGVLTVRRYVPVTVLVPFFQRVMDDYFPWIGALLGRRRAARTAAALPKERA